MTTSMKARSNRSINPTPHGVTTFGRALYLLKLRPAVNGRSASKLDGGNKSSVFHFGAGAVLAAGPTRRHRLPLDISSLRNSGIFAVISFK
jgi:hypothetical protein